MRTFVMLGLLSVLGCGCTNGEATKACSSKFGGNDTKADNPCAVCCKAQGSEQKHDPKEGKCICAWQPVK